MTRSDKLKIAAVTLYMLNPLGILAFASPKEPLAHHQFQVLNQRVMLADSGDAMQPTRNISQRGPASQAPEPYSCTQRLRK